MRLSGALERGKEQVMDASSSLFFLLRMPLVLCILIITNAHGGCELTNVHTTALAETSSGWTPQDFTLQVNGAFSVPAWAIKHKRPTGSTARVLISLNF